jgi:hypothetical protein
MGLKRKGNAEPFPTFAMKEPVWDAEADRRPIPGEHAMVME